jgi:hypothetical protein
MPAEDEAHRQDHQERRKDTADTPGIELDEGKSLLFRLLKMIVEIKNPEMTKKTSTPMKPPGNQLGNAWKPTTGSMASARRPSISGR